MSIMSKKKDTVSKKTFMKWDGSEDFDIEIDENQDVLEVRCKICTTYLHDIRREARSRDIKGSVLKSLLNYVDGVRGAHKGNFMRHIKTGGLHEWAKHTFSKIQPDDKPSQSSTSGVREKNQKSIEQATISSPAIIDNYRRLFSTALFIALKERPLSDFSDLIDLQKKNGIKFLHGKTHDKACGEFVDHLAETLRKDLITILELVTFLSLTMDGSQPRKTGFEKELVYTKVVIRGKAVELLLKCIHMNDFGGTADDLKRAIDSVMEEYNASEVYKTRLISLCCDGASINLGKYRGVATQIKETRLWLLIIHCVNHRLELAIKDGFKVDSAFSEICDMLLNMYLLTRNSGKVKSMLIKVALELDVMCVNFVKSEGTRFQNHKYRAIKAFIVNFIPMYMLMENYTSPGSKLGKKSMRENMTKWLAKFKEFRFLASLNFYYKVLENTAHLAYVMQDSSALITDITDTMSDCLQKIETLRNEKSSLPFASEKVGRNLIVSPALTNLPATKKFRERNEKALSNSNDVLLNVEFKVAKVRDGKQTVDRIKEKLLPGIKQAVDARFESFKEEIYQSIASICDHKRWDFDDTLYGVDALKSICEYFRKPLMETGFNKDLVIKEFREIKRIVNTRYRHLNAKQVWEAILTNHREKNKNICLLGEIILTIEWASSTVERGFSTTNRILVHSRKSLTKDRLNNLLLLRVNIPVLMALDPDYESKLISKAVESYIPGRYHKTKCKSSDAKKLDYGHKPSNDDDLFLPTRDSSDIQLSDFLSDDGHLIISEGESDNDDDLASHDDENSDDVTSDDDVHSD